MAGKAGTAAHPGPSASYCYQRSFQMFVKSNYPIAIATFSDLLKNLAPVFHPLKSKCKTNRTFNSRVFLRSEQVTGHY